MICCPCGSGNRSTPCMKDGKCSKYFPRDFQIVIIVDQHGFPVYRRRNNGNNVFKNDIHLDDRHVISYNPKLLKKFQAHINMEW